MCGMNLVANAYYYEWMLVATTNAYWALTQNLAAAQRRASDRPQVRGQLLNQNGPKVMPRDGG